VPDATTAPATCSNSLPSRLDIHQGETVLARWQFWITTVVALIAAIAAGYDMVLFGQNRATQADLAQRSQYVQQSLQLEGLYREIVRALADLSVRNQDKALGELLSAQGITVNTAPPATAAPTPDAKKGGKP
jgi:hypothetical protein